MEVTTKGNQNDEAPSAESNSATIDNISDEDEPFEWDRLTIAYFQEEHILAYSVMDTVVDDVLDILRSHGHHAAAACLWSAHCNVSAYADFVAEDLELFKCSASDRDKIHMDYIRGCSLKENQEDAETEEEMLRFLIAGMNTKDLNKEAGRGAAIEYTSERLNRAGKGIAYHARKKAEQERREYFEKKKQEELQA